jgi:hypothetical protein
VLQRRLFSATDETVQCCRGDCSVLQRRLFIATEETVQCCRGDCSVLQRRLFSAAEGLSPQRQQQNFITVSIFESQKCQLPQSERGRYAHFSLASIIIIIIAPAKIGLFVFVAKLFIEPNVQHNETTGFLCHAFTTAHQSV